METPTLCITKKITSHLDAVSFVYCKELNVFMENRGEASTTLKGPKPQGRHLTNDCDGASRSLSDSKGPSSAREGLPAAPHSCTFSGQVAKTSHPQSPA